MIFLFAIAVHTIRDIDFQNFTYHLWSGDYAVRAVNGRSQLAPDADPSDPTIEHIDVSYGDLTGDGREEAAVVVGSKGGGTGYFTEGFVFTLRNGKPVVLASFDGGDRSDNGIRAARIENRTLVVERNHRAGCAIRNDAVITTRYRLAGTRLLVVSHSRRAVSE